MKTGAEPEKRRDSASRLDPALSWGEDFRNDGRSVVFPDSLRPMTPRNSPWGTSTEMSRSACSSVAARACLGCGTRCSTVHGRPSGILKVLETPESRTATAVGAVGDSAEGGAVEPAHRTCRRKDH